VRAYVSSSYAFRLGVAAVAPSNLGVEFALTSCAYSKHYSADRSLPDFLKIQLKLFRVIEMSV